MSEKRPFAHPITVTQADIDHLGHVNNVVYLRWVQETAVAHWEAAAPADAQQKYHWIVLRHEIDYRAQALPGDPVSFFNDEIEGGSISMTGVRIG